MKVRPKLVLSFSIIFVIAFAISSYLAHITIESSLLNSGITEEQTVTFLEEIGTTIAIVSAIIGAAAVFVVFWVSTRIALPLRQLDSQLKAQRVGHKLRNIEIKRGSIDKDDEINEFVNVINSMINHLNDLEKKKEELLAIITHELKTPLSTMVGYSQILQRPKIVGKLNPTQTKALKIIDKNANFLRNQIINLLDSQKLDLEKMRFEYTYVDITKLLQKLEGSYQNKIKEKQIQIVNSTKEKLSTTTDRERLEQVLNHLILNAIDFTSQGGKVEFRAKSKDKEIIFYVKDNGIGIPLEKQKDVFNKMYEPGTISRRHGGTSLGLSICKGILEVLGGKIWLESEPGKGSTFYFNIPKKNKNSSI